MARLLLLTPLVAVIAIGVYLYLQSPPPLPQLDLNAWWGPERLKEKTDNKVKEFRIKFKESMIQDLKQYLKKTRTSNFVAPLEGVGFQYGFNSVALGTWLQHLNEYDFEARQKFLNQYPHYKTNIQGLDIHFLHIKPEVPKGVKLEPLLLLHGWPGSFREFYEAIPLLTAVDKNRDFALELIIPSLPGYGFSDAAVRAGLGAAEIAVVMRNLMQRLGYKQYYVQGGDWGSFIGSFMATLFPKEVLGFHCNSLLVFTPLTQVLQMVFSLWPTLIVEEKYVERMYPLSEKFIHRVEEAGYLHLQVTKPDTVGIALSDSPAGLLVYILEKFSTWTDPDLRNTTDGGLTKHFTKEQLLDNIVIYWSTQSITTSMRLYAEGLGKRHFGLKLEQIPTPVPTWAIQAKNELVYQPPFILRFKYPNLLHETVLDDGGHFLALQLPKPFSEDVIKAIAAFRDWHKSNTKSDL